MSGAPWVGLSLMPTEDFRKAALPLFSEGIVEGLQWSFDMGAEVPWSVALLDAYEDAGRLSGHGVHLGILSGGWSARQAAWLQNARECTTRRRYSRISEHWGFTTAGDFHAGAPLPIPYSHSSLSLGQDRMRRFAFATQSPVGLENLAFAFSAVDALVQGSFLDGLLRDLDGFVVLDLHNLYCQTENFNIDPVVLIESYPLDLVRELHISGGSTSTAKARDTVRRDTHDDAVPDAVFEMAELALLRCPHVDAIILERLGNTIGDESEAHIFRSDFERLIDLRNKCSGSELADVPVTDRALLAEPPMPPMTDEALAAFQARLLMTFEAQSEAHNILATLRTASECQDFLAYLDTFDEDMLEVAAVLTKKWGRH